MSRYSLVCFDSEDEEPSNTIGNVPLRWYDEVDHVGYCKLGRKIAKPEHSIRRNNEIDWFLNKMAHGGQWRSVYNSLTGEIINLSEGDVQLVKSIVRCDHPRTGTAEDPYAPWQDSDYSMGMPCTGAPPLKASFIPSLHEKRIVGRYLHAIKMGWLKTSNNVQKPKLSVPQYDLWSSANARYGSSHPRSALALAPKLPLPGHEESYNPLPEYRQADESYPSCLRHVPAYDKFTVERFERLLDLYLCPRMVNMKAQFDPATLLPPLPSPRDLRPFPCTQTRTYSYDQSVLGAIRCLCFDNAGSYFACASSESYSLWATSSERMVSSVHEESFFVARSGAMPLIAVAVTKGIRLCAIGSQMDIEVTRRLLSPPSDHQDSVCPWVECRQEKSHSMMEALLSIELDSHCMFICWHRKGDYMASLLDDNSIVIHQISKRRSHSPFDPGSKKPSKKVGISFHPSKPWFFISNRTSIRCYDLSASQLLKTLKVGTAGAFASSPFALHPSGDHLVAGCSDASVRWFDLEMGQRPYKTFRLLHKTTIQHAEFHPIRPLFATASNDGRVVVTHSCVYADFLKDPLIVPVKVLQLPKGLSTGESRIPVVSLAFHPQQAWLLASCTAKTDEKYTQIRLFTDTAK